MKYNGGSMTGGYQPSQEEIDEIGRKQFEAYEKEMDMIQQKQIKENKAGAAELAANVPSELDSSGKWKLPSDADVSRVWSLGIDEGQNPDFVGGPNGFNDLAITYTWIRDTVRGTGFAYHIQSQLVHPLNVLDRVSNKPIWFLETFLPIWILVAQHALDTNQILSTRQVCAIASRIVDIQAAEAERAEQSLQMLFSACEAGLYDACVSDEPEPENQAGGAKRYNHSNKHGRYPRKSIRNRGKKLRKTMRR